MKIALAIALLAAGYFAWAAFDTSITVAHMRDHLALLTSDRRAVITLANDLLDSSDATLAEEAIDALGERPFEQIVVCKRGDKFVLIDLNDDAVLNSAEKACDVH
jgi:hypothetical protein